MKHIVSLSGGKDSTAMLLMMLEKGMTVDEIIFCDTGKEFPQMYEHIEQVKQYINRPITVLRAKHTFDYYMFEYKRTRGKYLGRAGLGWPQVKLRWCTGLLKTDISNSYLSRKYKGQEIIQYEGIAHDEPKRIKGKHYPLVEWGITEKQALEYCYRKGFTWGGLYEDFDRVSCWCCPLQSLSELRILYNKYPELWAELMDMDRRSFNTFKNGLTLPQIEARFEWENMQKMKGYKQTEQEQLSIW